MATATNRKCNPREAKVGDVFSRISHGRVVGKDYRGLEVENEEGFKWSISNEIVAQEFYFVDQYAEEKEVTRTELATLVSETTRLNITVNFNKKPEHKDLVDLVEQLRDSGEIQELSRRKLSSTLKTATEGEERTMIGRHSGEKDAGGRIKFYDVDAKQPRLVDPRTINWAIIANVKYTVK